MVWVGRFTSAVRLRKGVDAVTVVDLAYFNFEHGGMVNASTRGDVPGGYDFTGLVRVLGQDDRWPHIIVMGEGDYYEYWGGAGMWGAAEAMRDAGGRAYVPLPCHLPREWGPFAPVIFFDAQTLIVTRYFDHRAPDFSGRNLNTLKVRPAGGGDELHVAALHGDLHEAAYRLADAKNLRWLAAEDKVSVVLADWNEHLSGPMFEPTDLEKPGIYDKPEQYLHRLRHTDGRPDRPYRRTTYALDYLCGYWDETEDRRVGGIGFVDAAEQAGITTGTNLPRPNGRQCVQLNHILLNKTASERVVPGSACIHPLLDPHPSDHRRVSVAIKC
jgi:hypothetical protein